MSLRTEKVGSLLKRVLATPVNELAKELKSGLVTITSVRVSPDLQLAKVYVSIFGKDISPGKVISFLDENKGSLKHHIAKNVRLRHIPELNFFIDDTLEEIDNIKKILDKVEKNKKEVKIDPNEYDESKLK